MPGRLRYLLFAFLLVGCTKPPAVPQLPPPARPATAAIILNDKISATEIRALFRALNADGRLSALGPWIDGSTDDELNALGEIIETYFFLQADRPDGLPELLRARFQRRSFALLDKTVLGWAARPPFSGDQAIGYELLADSRFPQLLERDHFFFDDSWLAALGVVRETAKSFRDRFAHPAVVALPDGGLALDVEKFLRTAPRARLLDVARTMERNGVGANLLETAAALQELQPSLAFEGFGHGVARLLPDPGAGATNHLAKVLQFVRVANASTDGLFKMIQQKMLGDPNVVQQTGRLSQPLLSRAIAGFIRQTLADPKYDATFWKNAAAARADGGPSTEYTQIFLNVLRAVQQLSGTVVPKAASPGSFATNLPIYLNAFALTEWLVASVQTAKTLADPFWETTFTPAAQAVVFWVKNGNATTYPLEKKMTELCLAGFFADFKKFVEDGIPRPITYRLLPTATKLGPALVEVATQCSRTFAFNDASILARLVSLESDNLMDTANRILGFLGDFSFVRQIETILFQVLGLVDPNGELTLLLEGFFKETPLYDKAKGLLNPMASIQELDRPAVAGLPTPFEAYYHWMRYTRPAEAHGPTDVLSYLAEAKIWEFSTTGPEYPTVYGFARQGEPVAQVLYGLAALKADERADFLKPFQKMLGTPAGNLGTDLHLQVLDLLWRDHPAEMRSIFQRFQAAGGDVFAWEQPFTPSERRWLADWVQNGDGRKVWKYFSDHATRDSSRRLTTELQKLSASGDLEYAIKLLAFVRSDRMQKLAAILLEGSRSGELSELLKALQTILANP